MSARILSMGPTTLRFAWADHEIACRYFLTHLMNIGSPTLRFREAATRRQAIHARWVIGNRYPTYQEIFAAGNRGNSGLLSGRKTNFARLRFLHSLLLHSFS